MKVIALSDHQTSVMRTLRWLLALQILTYPVAALPCVVCLAVVEVVGTPEICCQVVESACESCCETEAPPMECTPCRCCPDESSDSASLPPPPRQPDRCEGSWLFKAATAELVAIPASLRPSHSCWHLPAAVAVAGTHLQAQICVWLN